MNTNWYIIANARAGSSQTFGLWEKAQKELDAYGVGYTLVRTEHRGHARELARDAAAAGWRKLLAVGGDGSIHEVMGGVLDWCADNGGDPAEFTLGVAPIGSGNDWIKSFGISNDAMKIIPLMAEGRSGKEDVFHLQFGDGRRAWMANGAGTGFDAHVCQRVNHQKERGLRSKMIYLDALRYTIFHIKPIRVRVTGDGKEYFCGECYSIALGNGKYSGGGMRQVPLAEPDDGLLDVLVVPKARLARLVPEIPRLFAGTVHQSALTISFRCRELSIEPLDDASRDIVEVDGEIEGQLPLSVRLDGRKLNVLSAKAPVSR
jgi:YegS/Rv2252/BmrU family lipid kinase